jgi:AcrR family transcriptional regulator
MAIKSAARRPVRRVRQRRGLRTEAAILDATLQSLAVRGIHATSLDLIAAEVGVAKSSILWHFGSKEGLLLRVAERAFEEMEKGPARDILSLPSLEERSRAVWDRYLQSLERRPALRRVVLYLIFESTEGRPELRARLQRLYRSLRTLFAAGLRENVGDAERARGIATLAVATLDGLFLQWLLEPEALDLPALQRQLRGVAQARGAGVRPSATRRRAS